MKILSGRGLQAAAAEHQPGVRDRVGGGAARGPGEAGGRVQVRVRDNDNDYDDGDNDDVAGMSR